MIYLGVPSSERLRAGDIVAFCDWDGRMFGKPPDWDYRVRQAQASSRIRWRPGLYDWDELLLLPARVGPPGDSDHYVCVACGASCLGAPGGVSPIHGAWCPLCTTIKPGTSDAFDEHLRSCGWEPVVKA